MRTPVFFCISHLIQNHFLVSYVIIFKCRHLQSICLLGMIDRFVHFSIRISRRFWENSWKRQINLPCAKIGNFKFYTNTKKKKTVDHWHRSTLMQHAIISLVKIYTIFFNDCGRTLGLNWLILKANATAKIAYCVCVCVFERRQSLLAEFSILSKFFASLFFCECY